MNKKLHFDDRTNYDSLSAKLAFYYLRQKS